MFSILLQKIKEIDKANKTGLTPQKLCVTVDEISNDYNKMMELYSTFMHSAPTTEIYEFKNEVFEFKNILQTMLSTPQIKYYYESTKKLLDILNQKYGTKQLTNFGDEKF